MKIVGFIVDFLLLHIRKYKKQHDNHLGSETVNNINIWGQHSSKHIFAM